MNLAHFDAQSKGRGQGRGKGRGGKGSGYHGPKPTIRRGAVGQVGAQTARQEREPNRDSCQLYFPGGDRVPGSLNVSYPDGRLDMGSIDAISTLARQRSSRRRVGDSRRRVGAASESTAGQTHSHEL